MLLKDSILTDRGALCRPVGQWQCVARTLFTTCHKALFYYDLDSALDSLAKLGKVTRVGKVTRITITLLANGSYDCSKSMQLLPLCHLAKVFIRRFWLTGFRRPLSSQLINRQGLIPAQITRTPVRIK